MRISLLLYYVVFISIPFDYCTDYYLKTEGIDSISCITYSNACGTLDYLMKTLLTNIKGDHTVYIDTGTHNYTIISDISDNCTSCPFLPIQNVISFFLFF
jgi:hypothetical protein